MKPHIRAAIKYAKKLGGSCEWLPSNGHGKLRLTCPKGRETVLTCSFSPRDYAHCTRILKGQIAKFFRGKATSAVMAQHQGRKP